uniref:Transmembrane protein n=1 Tax=Meloidogyne hapla TaxID=6305 RepID=A0A1I8B9W7_MELHA
MRPSSSVSEVVLSNCLISIEMVVLLFMLTLHSIVLCARRQKRSEQQSIKERRNQGLVSEAQCTNMGGTRNTVVYATLITDVDTMDTKTAGFSSVGTKRDAESKMGTKGQSKVETTKM